jgi:solute:Na+ symporter, SSS family
MNGIVKIPMQFAILLIGVLIFSFYQFYPSPLSFNDGLVSDVQHSSYKDSMATLQNKFNSVNTLKGQKAAAFANAVQNKNQKEVDLLSNELKGINSDINQYRKEFTEVSKKVSAKETNDTNYVFLSFVKQYLPAGLKGLLIAVIFLAAWGSIAAALNSLASSTVVDFHKRHCEAKTDLQEYRLSKWYTLGWGIFCILVAQFAGKIGQSLIEAVNVLGSLFYGVILGVFLIAFYIKRVGGTATFYAALIVECFIILLFFNEQIPFINALPDIGFLWLNAIGAIGVILVGAVLQNVVSDKVKLNKA